MELYAFYMYLLGQYFFQAQRNYRTTWKSSNSIKCCCPFWRINNTILADYNNDLADYMVLLNIIGIGNDHDTFRATVFFYLPSPAQTGFKAKVPGFSFSRLSGCCELVY